VGNCVLKPLNSVFQIRTHQLLHTVCNNLALSIDRNSTMATPATRTKALSLYRKLLRAAMRMPTPNRQNFVIRKTRIEFKTSMSLTDPDAINEAIRLADTNLDTVMVQAEHLTKLMNDPNYQADI
jgi:hypothetical protein